MTRRALLVAGGVTLLAGCAKDPALRVTDAARTDAARTDAARTGAARTGAARTGAARTGAARTGAAHDRAHPAPEPGRAPTSSPAGTPAAGPTRSASTPPASTPPASTGPARARLDRARKQPARGGRRGQAGDLPMTHVDDGRKGIALTIDDGPSPVYTPRVLQLLDKYQVTATFSMVGLEVAAHPALAREVAAAGHVIANHTWSHLDLAWMPSAGIADQINRTNGAIHRATGQEPTLFRAPYGAWSPAVLQYCAQTAMTPLDWSVDPRDWSRPGVTSIVSNIMRNTKTGSIILEHDGGGNRAQTVAALTIVLPRLLDAGYHFTTP